MERSHEQMADCQTAPDTCKDVCMRNRPESNAKHALTELFPYSIRTDSYFAKQGLILVVPCIDLCYAQTHTCAVLLFSK